MISKNFFNQCKYLQSEAVTVNIKRYEANVIIFDLQYERKSRCYKFIAARGIYEHETERSTTQRNLVSFVHWKEMHGNYQWLRDGWKDESGKWAFLWQKRINFITINFKNKKSNISHLTLHRKIDKRWLYTIFNVGWECTGISRQIRRMDGDGPATFTLLH